MDKFSNLGQFLKKHRAQKNMTQAELAAELKMHSQFVSNWERGLCAPPSDKFQALIELLKIDRKKLLDAMLADAKIEIKAKVHKKNKIRAPEESAI
jgi:transcriptional regulator with XRE-family HTH domain